MRLTNRSKVIMLVAGVTLWAGVATRSVQANLIVNGNFETGLLGTDWVQGCANPPLGDPTYIPPFSTDVFNVSPYTGIAAQSKNGSGHAYLINSWKAPTELSQTIPTIIGQEYELSFYVSLLLPNSWTAGPGDVRGSEFDLFNAKVAGAPVFIYQGSPNPGVGPIILPYALHAATFTATGTTTVVQFQGETMDDWIYLDDVSVVPVPEPATMSLLGMGLVGLLARRRRR